MGHIYYDQNAQFVAGKTLTLRAMKSTDQLRVELLWRGKRVDPRVFGQSSGKPLLSFHLSWARWRKPRSFVAKLNVGRGSGYIGGYTAFFGWRCKGGRIDYQKYPYAGSIAARWRLGFFTQNANKVPYPNW